MRILIVRLGAFGDIIHTLPLAADLHAAGHEVAWLCEDRWAEIIDGSPAIAEILTLPRRSLRDKSLPLAVRWRLVRQRVQALRAGEFDLVIDAQGLAKSAIWAARSGVRRRVGHQRGRAREGSWLLPARRVPASATHVIDQQRALGLGVPGSQACGGWRFPLPAWDSERNRMHHWLGERGLRRPVVINVGAGWPTKVWPAQRQTELAELLINRGSEVVVAWGNAAERSVAEGIVDAVPHAVLAPQTSIPELGGLLANSAALVSGDTGPLHLALALGTPAVGLFGPVPAERNGPRGRGYRCLQAPGARWERRDVSKVDMSAITAGQVADALTTICSEDPRRD